MSTTPQLHLLHLQPDARLLAAWMARHQARHTRQSTDLGDALHGLLRAALGTHAPQPFRYLDEHRGLLAYTGLESQAFEAHVASADPLAAQALGLCLADGRQGYRLRPFPNQWAPGHELNFDVRVRPTVRGAKGEQDAFLHAVAQAGGPQGAPLQREAVYAEWLRQHLSARQGAERQPWQGAVELLDVRLRGFARSNVLRRTQAQAGQEREGKAVEGPDAVLTGRLRVADTAAFAHLLARGVGRHRSFGFGMLLLQPAG
ncbi:type I-E CRISPR-associated protein Cas6/Cse3/CasE [Pulveribacter sp.]|uniref:type I-E CRISPR-associated protein Cas6/Cse3/CasE n=1 Tax=Pulveribacter sp. TaxID=2678893 RepID=UPI0028B1BA6F|nr:type I-E CRISPR-associated protein Cas6/Cse3/CasE [Pulveribacter sp.]